MFSGSGNESFRGKVYSAIVEEITGVSLYGDAETNEIPNATVTFGIFDYCREFFQPITNDVERSSHELTGIELIESYPVEVYYEPYQLSYFYCTGNLNMTFLINDQVSLATGRYKIKVEIWEKL